jgi:hypothetical protein
MDVAAESVGLRKRAKAVDSPEKKTHKISKRV